MEDGEWPATSGGGREARGWPATREQGTWGSIGAGVSARSRQGSPERVSGAHRSVWGRDRGAGRRPAEVMGGARLEGLPGDGEPKEPARKLHGAPGRVSGWGIGSGWLAGEASRAAAELGSGGGGGAAGVAFIGAGDEDKLQELGADKDPRAIAIRSGDAAAGAEETASSRRTRARGKRTEVGDGSDRRGPPARERRATRARAKGGADRQGRPVSERERKPRRGETAPTSGARKSERERETGRARRGNWAEWVAAARGEYLIFFF